MSQAEGAPPGALPEEGWTRRFTAMGAHLTEAVEVYRGLGFEVRLEPADSGAEQLGDSAACGQCFVMSLARTIYTRPSHRRSGAPAAER